MWRERYFCTFTQILLIHLRTLISTLIIIRLFHCLSIPSFTIPSIHPTLLSTDQLVNVLIWKTEEAIYSFIRLFIRPSNHSFIHSFTKWQQTKWYGQNGIQTKWYWTKWCGQNGTDKMVWLKYYG